MNNSVFLGSVATSLLMTIVDFCFSKKINLPEECFFYLDAKTFLPNNINERVPFQVWNNILHKISLQYPVEGLGLEIAQHIQLAHAGILSYLAFSEANLLDALLDFINYNRLVYDFNSIKFYVDQDFVKVNWEYTRGHPGLLIDETAIAFTSNMVKKAIYPHKISVKKINFIYHEPRNKKIYEDYFGCPVIFNSDVTSMTLSFSEVESIFLQRVDPILCKILKNQANRLLEKLEIYDDIEHRLYLSIRYCIKNKNINIIEVAKHMGISKQELKKDLFAANINFNQAVNKVRENLAKEYLSDKNFNMNEISDLLGYAEQSVFQRAFKNWTKKTPLQFRKDILKKS